MMRHFAWTRLGSLRMKRSIPRRRNWDPRDHVAGKLSHRSRTELKSKNSREYYSKCWNSLTMLSEYRALAEIPWIRALLTSKTKRSPIYRNQLDVNVSESTVKSRNHHSRTIVMMTEMWANKQRNELTYTWRRLDWECMRVKLLFHLHWWNLQTNHFDLMGRSYESMYIWFPTRRKRNKNAKFSSSSRWDPDSSQIAPEIHVRSYQLTLSRISRRTRLIYVTIMQLIARPFAEKSTNTIALSRTQPIRLLVR